MSVRFGHKDIPGQTYRGKRQAQGYLSLIREVVVLSRVDEQVPFLKLVPYGSKKSLKAKYLCLESYHFSIIRKEQR